MRNDFSDIKDGISQPERFLKELDPTLLEIEGRKIPDLVAFIIELSRQFNYYNLSNNIEGTWEDFFKTDSSILMVMHRDFDISNYFNTLSQFHKEVMDLDNNMNVRLDNLKNMFRIALTIMSTLEKIYAEFSLTTDWHEVEDVFLNMRDVVKDAVKIMAIYHKAVDKLSNKLAFDTYQKPGDVALLEAIDHVKFKYDLPFEEQVSYVAALFAFEMSEVLAKYNRLLKSGRDYLQYVNMLDKSYTPHAGLIITFLKLYGHLKTKINGITKRHLDYYYNDILGIGTRDAIPDKLHVLFDPDNGNNTIKLDQGELLQAYKPGRETPVYYELVNDISVSRTTIAELKTLFVSSDIDATAPGNHIPVNNRAQVYIKENPVFSPGAFQKNPDEIISWPALGEDQQNLSGNMQTMEIAETGLVIASPLLFLPEGERTVKFVVSFKRDGFLDTLHDLHPVNPPDFKKASNNMADFLSSAFNIEYTGTKGWQKVNAYYINYNYFNAIDSVEIWFILEPNMDALDVYNEKTHKQNYPLTLPAVRLMINNYSSHEPYFYLRKLLIKRITIRVNVLGFTGLKLQNNIGALSPANPFQPFGPIPNVGSFIDIKNANVFNRYTKNFNVNFEWLELPRDLNGFADYYRAYHLDIRNSSFKVGLSALNSGTFLPPPDKQQKFDLFESEPNSQQLKNKTIINNVDFKKIEFLNEAKIAEENLLPELFFREGAIRLDLQEPAQAFGHREFAHLFPEAVMKNAKKKRNKEPLPSQPFVPLVKSLSVDYFLEHSENFKDAGNEQSNDVVLIHHYPFGYEKAYPGNIKKYYYFFPQFEHQSNLMIGLKDAEARQELTFLFQLEEKNFHHTFHKSDNLCWSYLENNTWTPFDKKNILRDETNNFINSGIVKLKLPPVITTGNTLLNPSLFWLRVSLPKSSNSQSKIMALYPNAALAVRVNDKDLETETDFRLAPFSITGFTRNIKGIQSSWQLFPSFGGRAHEETSRYYVRLSERLRHKNRPVQAQDIMQVILQEFPEIQMVKCFGISDENAPIVPGVNLQVVVIPKEMDDGRFTSDQPQVSLSTLYKVKKFLKGLISPFVTVEVGNPVYEKIKIICKVMFTDATSADYGYYEKKLVVDLNGYIAPWLYANTDDIKMGSKIYKSDILMFIMNRPYVSYITGFSAVHFYKTKNETTNELDALMEDTAVENLDYISGSGPGAVLIPSPYHIITTLNKAFYEDPKPAGIGNLIIGEEFLVKQNNKPGLNSKVKKEREIRDDEKFNLLINHNIK